MRTRRPISPLPFERGDFVAAAVVFVLSLAVYWWTAAPSVTLLDSGEFLVAAQHFGVPHPTGYPLWTMLAWGFSLLPLGNAAWEINLLSGLLGALAVAQGAMLGRSFLRWMFPETFAGARGLGTLCSVTAALLFGFSFSMWSQAVIAEVYTLHALLSGSFLVALYCWIRDPEREGRLFAAFFFLVLSFSNHQLAMAFAPLPFLAVCVVRPKIFWDVFVAGCVTAGLFYGLMAWLSADALVIKAAVRFGITAGCFSLFYYMWRKGAGTRFLLWIPIVVALGLTPYAYLPFASSTNPPMNWSYARELSGLFHSFNRSQYSGALTDQSLRVVGKLMGVPSKTDLTPPPPKNRFAPEERTAWETARDWAGFFLRQLARSFTFVGIAAWALAAISCFQRQDRRRWIWLVILNGAFVLAALLQPVLDRAEVDVGGWWLQLPYHTYTNFVFSLLCAYGFFRFGSAVLQKPPWMRPALGLAIFLPLVPLIRNAAECSQRGKWFGWEYGHTMLKDLPKGSVVVGGSDPGRFVPTYMIFGESPQRAEHKRDPGFERKDLYIITQNALGDPAYMRYLRDQYTEDRPLPKNAFERWLGREEAYPIEPLVLPSEEEVKQAIALASMPDPYTGKPLEPNLSILPFSAVLYWIWLNNKDWHDFFIEESFPISWTYDYAIPSGFSYRLSPFKIPEIPADAVQKDMTFWKAECERLLADPLFLDDLDARRSFARLRCTIGNIYWHRRMQPEAEQAYVEALSLNPADGGIIQSLMFARWERGEFETPIAEIDRAKELDPNNRNLAVLRTQAVQRKEVQKKIVSLENRLRQNSGDKNTIQQIVMLHAATANLAKAEFFLTAGLKVFANDPAFLRFAAAHYELNGQPLNSLGPALRLIAIEPQNPANHFILAHSLYAHNKLPEFYDAMTEAIKLGGVPFRDMFASDRYFERLREDPTFVRLLKIPGAASPPPPAETQRGSSLNEGR